jgi:hypothetical protein
MNFGYKEAGDQSKRGRLDSLEHLYLEAPCLEREKDKRNKFEIMSEEAYEEATVRIQNQAEEYLAVLQSRTLKHRKEILDDISKYLFHFSMRGGAAVILDLGIAAEIVNIMASPSAAEGMECLRLLVHSPLEINIVLVRMGIIEICFKAIQGWDKFLIGCAVAILAVLGANDFLFFALTYSVGFFPLILSALEDPEHPPEIDAPLAKFLEAFVFSHDRPVEIEEIYEVIDSNEWLLHSFDTQLFAGFSMNFVDAGIIDHLLKYFVMSKDNRVICRVLASASGLCKRFKEFRMEYLVRDLTIVNYFQHWREEGNGNVAVALMNFITNWFEGPDFGNNYAERESMTTAIYILEKYEDDDRISGCAIHAIWNLVETNWELASFFEFDKWFEKCSRKIENGSFKERKYWMYLAFQIGLHVNLKMCTPAFFAAFVEFLGVTRGRLCFVGLFQLNMLFKKDREEGVKSEVVLSLIDIFAQCNGMEVIWQMCDEELESCLMDQVKRICKEYRRLSGGDLDSDSD